MSDTPPTPAVAPAPPEEPTAPPARPNIAQVVVSVVILVMWAKTIIAQQFGFAAPNESTAQLLETAVTLIIGYWLGSSFGSAAKDAVLNRVWGVVRRACWTLSAACSLRASQTWWSWRIRRRSPSLSPRRGCMRP